MSPRRSAYAPRFHRASTKARARLASFSGAQALRFIRRPYLYNVSAPGWAGLMPYPKDLSFESVSRTIHGQRPDSQASAEFRFVINGGREIPSPNPKDPMQESVHGGWLDRVGCTNTADPDRNALGASADSRRGPLSKNFARLEATRRPLRRSR